MRDASYFPIAAAIALVLGACASTAGDRPVSAQGDKGGLTSQPLDVKLLGVVTESVPNAVTARRRGLPEIMRGALITRVIKGKPGHRAGLRRDDLITEIRADGIGWSVESRDNLSRVLARFRPHDRFRVEVFRGPAPKHRSSYATKLLPVRLSKR